jgi:hypothetical protein
MKALIFPFLFLLCLCVQAEICDLNNSYIQRGWVIHESSEFSHHLSRVQELIESGLGDGSFEEDLNGVLSTNRTIDGSRIYVRTISWDNLDTDRAIMYGDVAIFTDHFSQGHYLEVRWFDGTRKHVVYNNQYLSCISIIPSFADNTIM